MTAMDTRRTAEIGRLLERHLHAPQDLGLETEPGGWVRIDALVLGLQKLGHRVGLGDLEVFVRTDPDESYSIDASGEKIRTNAVSSEEELDVSKVHRLGDFELEKWIGKGGMGDVYLATQLSLRRKVALKVLPRSLAEDPDFCRRFLAEARAVAALTHTNVVQVHTVGIDDDTGRLYFAMEYIKGRSLTEVMKDNPPSFGAICHIAKGVARALEHAWEKGILHRDIKPSNIMIGSKMRVKVLDFGLAKSLKSNTRLTATGVVVGTPDYMSPEQAAGNPLDCRADLYSLGVVLYQLLGGQRPYVAGSVSNLLFLLSASPPRSIRAARPNVPRRFEAIVERLLAKHPDDRFKHPRQLISELKKMRAWLHAQKLDDDLPEGPPITSITVAEAERGPLAGRTLHTGRPRSEPLDDPLPEADSPPPESDSRLSAPLSARAPTAPKSPMPLLIVGMLAAVIGVAALTYVVTSSLLSPPVDGPLTPPLGSDDPPAVVFEGWDRVVWADTVQTLTLSSEAVPGTDGSSRWKAVASGEIHGIMQGRLSQPIHAGIFRVEGSFVATGAPDFGIYVEVAGQPLYGLGVKSLSEAAQVWNVEKRDPAEGRVSLDQGVAAFEDGRLPFTLSVYGQRLRLELPGLEFERALPAGASGYALFVGSDSFDNPAGFAEVGVRHGEVAP